jgi:hypothetical protein
MADRIPSLNWNYDENTFLDLKIDGLTKYMEPQEAKLESRSEMRNRCSAAHRCAAEAI